MRSIIRGSLTTAGDVQSFLDVSWEKLARVSQYNCRGMLCYTARFNLTFRLVQLISIVSDKSPFCQKEIPSVSS